MIQMNQWKKNVIAGNRRMAIPIMTHPGIELNGHTVRQAITDGAVHAQAIIRLNEEYPADACTVIMDLTVEAEAFGAPITFPEEEVPSITGRLVHDYASIEALQIPSLSAARVPEYIKANRLVAERITNKPIFGGCIGPFSLAGRLYDLSEFLMAIYIEPEAATLLLEKATLFLIEYCLAMKQTGVNGIIIAEPAAGLISNEDCIRFSTNYVRRIVDAVQDDSFMVILHNCGNSGHCTPAMVQSGAYGLHFGNKVDMVEALKNCPEDVLVMGNLDPVGLFKQSTPEEVRTATLELLGKTAPWKNFVLSTGCDVPPLVPFENIEAFYSAVQDYNSSNL